MGTDYSQIKNRVTDQKKSHWMEKCKTDKMYNYIGDTVDKPKYRTKINQES